jgi:hypothetical protein
MNSVELKLARTQATVIIHNLMQELTTFVTRSLGGATGEEDVTMTEVPEERRHTITTVCAQAESHARMQYKEMRAEAGLPAEQQGQQSDCTTGTASLVVEEAATALEMLPGPQAQPTLPDEGED